MSLGFIFGCLRQHIKFLRCCRGVILVDFCFFASSDPYFVLKIFEKKNFVFDSYGFGKILISIKRGVHIIIV